MPHYHFTYDELTPLEQCIADFMLRQQEKRNRSKASEEERELTLKALEHDQRIWIAHTQEMTGHSLPPTPFAIFT